MRGQPGLPCVRRWAVAIGACACLLVVAAKAEDNSAIQREVEEAKAEDEADRARGEGFESEKTFSGRLVLGQVAENRADIVGIFTIDKGRAYPVKLENETLLNELKEYDRKTVSLQGKFRNQGKYFVVTAIIPPPAPTPRVRKIGGL